MYILDWGTLMSTFSTESFSCRWGSKAGPTIGTLERAGWLFVWPVGVSGAVMRIWMKAPPGQATGPSEVSAGSCSGSAFSTHTAAARLPGASFCFPAAKMCSSPPVRKWEECDLPRFLPSPCESAHILKLNPHAAGTTALQGDYKLGGDYQIAPRICPNGEFCVTEMQKGLWTRSRTGCK